MAMAITVGLSTVDAIAVLDDGLPSLSKGADGPVMVGVYLAVVSEGSARAAYSDP